MSNLTVQPPPQLSKDGRWRWDGTQWVPVKSSKRPGLPGPGAPQHSSDGRWWWNGYQWVPAQPAPPTPPKPPRATLAEWALRVGLCALASLPFILVAFVLGTADADGGTGPYSLSAALVILALPLSGAVLGVVLGVWALVSPRQRDGRSPRRGLAWGGIAASLATAAGVVLMSLLAAAVAAGS